MVFFKKNQNKTEAQEARIPNNAFLQQEKLHLDEDGTTLNAYELSDEAIEKGHRLIALPEGIAEIADGAFDGYNLKSERVAKVKELLLSRTGIYEIEKRILQRKITARDYPKELKTLAARRDYIADKEKRERLLKLSLPQSLVRVSRSAFPLYLEEIAVHEQNPSMQSIGGVLFSKDGTTLLRYPGLLGGAEYVLPESVSHILPGAFDGAIIDTLVLPGVVARIGSGWLSGAHIKTLVIGEGVTCIAPEAFSGSNIQKIILPSTLAKIEPRAFCGISGLLHIEGGSTQTELGSKLFEGCELDGVAWWCWSKIPDAAFLNSRLAKIDIPAGVDAIGAYAFAGCYTAKSISIPDSVTHIGDFAFDLGPTYCRPVNLPSHLYRFIYRFPARSPVNKNQRRKLMQLFEDAGLAESCDILQRQKLALETLPALQKRVRFSVKQQLAFIDRRLSSAVR